MRGFQMAHITSDTGHFPESVLHILGKPFKAIGNFMVSIMENNSRLKRVERLSQMSDAELAKRGLKREDIVRHVFADLMHI